MLEKNPQLRIELNNSLIEEWLNDDSKIVYKRKKQQAKDKDMEKFEFDEKIEFEEPSNLFNTDRDKKDMDGGKLITNNYFNSNSKNSTANLDLITAESDDDVLREPAKFDTSDDDNTNYKFNNSKVNSISNNSLKNKIEQLNLNTRQNKKSTTLTSKASLSFGGSNGLSSFKRSSPKRITSKTDKEKEKEKESPMKKNYK